MVDIVIAKATGSPWSEVLGHPEGHLNGQDRRTFGPWHLSLGANIGFAYREDINEKTLPKALRTQALTALTSNCGLVGLVQYAWKAMFDLFW